MYFLPVSSSLSAENEAVVAELLRNAKGGLELVDAREFLPLFRCRPGLSDWRVIDDFFAVKNETREKRSKDKAVEGANEIDATEAPQENNDAAEGAADAASGEAATGDVKPQGKRAIADFSHIEDADLRACLEMGMSYYPDFASVPAHMDRKVRKSFFPPSAEEKQWMHLGKSFLLPTPRQGRILSMLSLI
jgi:hypothetical protein